MESSQPGQTRRRLDEQAWRAVLERFDGAAMSVQEFCLREGLARSSFSRWRSRLRTAPRKRMHAVAPAKAVNGVPTASFVDLGVLGAAAAASAPAEHAGLDLRIELGSGLSLHLVRR